ncbi:MAG: hypothetical protein IH598_14935 [Bacteroidales bacterium]|nr:hypothetical protein [Bacteroidales bacterium]
MKHLVLILIISSLIFLFSIPAFTQGISINENGTPPDPSAMLDVESTTKGFLPPRLTSAQRLAMQYPASGLVVFDTDFNALFVNTGEGWMQVDAGEKWLKDEDNNLTYNLGKVGIGVNYPEAELEVDGQVKITGGDPGAGKVLTSDEGGTASWQNSPMSILNVNQAVGYTNISTGLNFLVLPATVELTETSSILIHSTRGMGSTTGVNSTGSMNLYLCYRNINGGSIVSIGGGIFGLMVPAGTRIPFSLSSTTGFLAPGTYEVGLCGTTNAPSQWNSNEFGYTTAMAYKLPADKSYASRPTDDNFESLLGREPESKNNLLSKTNISPDSSADVQSSQDYRTTPVEEKIEQLRLENESIKNQLNILLKMIETEKSTRID